MKTTVGKIFDFEAAHSLPYLPSDHKCSRVHGHSYRFRVDISGTLDERGFVIDYAEIAEAINPIVRKLDHRNLNDLFDFATTAENIAFWIFEEVKLKIPNICRVVFWETASTEVVIEL